MADCPTIDEVLAMPKSVWYKLGSGGQGDVYKIGDYVLKIIPFYNNPKTSAAFQMEKVVLEELAENPFVAGFLPQLCSIEVKEVYGQSRGYILQRYEKVLSLMEVMEDLEDESKKLNYEIGSEIIRNLIEGLMRLHIAGYVHRDIKPENILIRLEGDITKPIFIDFGLACKMPCEGASLAGTLRYIPSNFLPPSARVGVKNPYRVKTSFLPYKSKKLYDTYAMAITIQQLMKFIDFTSGTAEQITGKLKFKQSVLRHIEKTKRDVMIDAAAIKGELISNKYRSNANTRRRLENLNTSVRNKMLKQNAGSRKTRKH